jgi:hypothetical protein
MHMEWDCIDVVIFLEDFLVSESHKVTKVNPCAPTSDKEAS